jgi:modification methylase
MSRESDMMKGTKTSSFGSSKRENHDSTIFYSSKLYEEINFIQNASGLENPLPKQLENTIFNQDAKNMDLLPDECVHLVVTSPGYNVGKDYDENLSLSDYLEMLSDVFSECYRVLVDGGRMVVNIANVGRKPYIALHSHIINIMQNIGFQMRGEIIWDKGASAGSSTAWGSWMSPSNPVMRDVHEYLLVFNKGGFTRKNQFKPKTITRDEFLDYTKSVWTFNTISAKKVGHPAPFPIELPYRCIQLYTYGDEVVLDPFMGSGTTAIAALNTNRRFIGFEINENYYELSVDRIETWKLEKYHKKVLKD